MKTKAKKDLFNFMHNYLKNFLLSTNFFEDNDYFEQYLQLVTTGSLINADYKEEHHILPVSYYGFIKGTKNRAEARMLADADIRNRKVFLTRRDHCLAHCLLYFCTIGKLKRDSATTVIMFTHKLNNFPGLNDTPFEVILDYIYKIQNDPNNNYFTAAEDQFLVTNYATLGVLGCAKALQRPKGSITTRAKYLGIKSNVTYTAAQKEFIRQHYPNEGADYCAVHLNRTKEAIQKYAETTLHIKGRKREKQIYCVELDTYFKSAVAASEVLQISRTSICNALKGYSNTAGGYHWMYKQEK